MLDGVRRSDCYGLTPSSIVETPVEDDEGARSLAVHRKGDKREELLLPADVAAGLLAYVETFRLGAQHFLFMPVRKGGTVQPEIPLTADDMTRIVRARTKAALGRPYSPHAWRATFATQAILAGVPLEEVQRYMGHERVETTLLYFHDLPLRHRSAAEAVSYDRKGNE